MNEFVDQILDEVLNYAKTIMADLKVRFNLKITSIALAMYM